MISLKKCRYLCWEFTCRISSQEARVPLDAGEDFAIDVSERLVTFICVIRKSTYRTTAMGETVRTVCLVLLAIHHLLVWKHLIGIRSESLTPKEANVLSVFKDYGLRFQTNWNFFNQTLYIALSLIILALFKIQGSESTLAIRLQKFNWFNFWSIVLPWTMFIPAFFWGLFIYDRQLIFPEVIDRIFPLWLNHAVHTDILIIIITELLLVSRRPPLFNKAIKTLTMYAVTYVAVLEYTHIHNGIWLYPLFGELSWTQRILTYAAIQVSLVTFMWSGLAIQNFKYNRNLPTKRR